MERQPMTDRPEAGEGRRYVGCYADRVAYGKKLADDLGLADYEWEVPRHLRPYLRLDYELIVSDMSEVLGVDVVETPDGLHVYEALP